MGSSLFNFRLVTAGDSDAERDDGLPLLVPSATPFTPPMMVTTGRYSDVAPDVVT